ncbi:gliding motility lipoprotein, FGE_sulfatase superfamily GldJ [Psychroflexus torquis ATCC 700755]|uniref:Gliding motility lipoprotein, FGE_sulfatase superfamily GldJ n=1 Tax=Psychroflexus torquis (strain ATCC 700755 / CIP 106069 / ACAM 623) TaxID=313595 RepID=K4IHH7_PSYTT|nr:gliding motility lipoprotein GldJ [Psychroflexus torquis]AFU69268.1 gliding motility lipoprotein, FGE_sulfatase superfamily GldJ [Psychroflexus torquis ATCC 700755]
MKNFLKSCILVSLVILATSCNNSRDYNSSSRATGWDLSGRDGGVSYKTDYEEQEPGPGLVFVEGGTFTMGRVKDDVMHDWNNTPTQQHVQSFYIDETEATNVMYLEYLDWLKQVFPPTEERYKNIYTGALPDTLVWRNPLGFNENMVNNYLRHPAFHTYPVVGVNWIQATEFSQWRTDRVNEKRLSDKGYTSRDAYKNSSADNIFSTETYLNAPSKVYGGNDSITRGGRETDRKLRNNPDSSNVYVQRRDGELLPAYRLPTEAEWEYAALGQSSLRDYNSYRGRKKYPWDGQYTRSEDGRTIGDQLANFKQGQGDYGGIAGWSDDGADITSEVRSYESNDYGLYDMAGNVSEWVADVYRPRLDNEYNDFNYFRGNVYTKNAITEEGKVKVLTADEVIYDTLSNGKIIARNIPGELAQTSIGDQETYLRTQFSKSDNINFRDGDKSSSRYYNKQGNTVKGEDMYNSPDNEVTLKNGEIDRRYDGSSTRTTLIDDNVRVYKGGSWRDREYWLDPAQRRYFPQDMATDDIGFRNAMSKVGSKSNKGRRTRN